MHIATCLGMYVCKVLVQESESVETRLGTGVEVALANSGGPFCVVADTGIVQESESADTRLGTGVEVALANSGGPLSPLRDGLHLGMAEL